MTTLSRSGARGVLVGFVLLLGCAMSHADDLNPEWPARHGHAHDPGPRPNPASPVPNPVQGLNANESALFIESLLRVSELEGTCDTCSQQPQNQLPVDPSPSNPFSPRGLVNS